jgi:aminopeptidase N
MSWWDALWLNEGFATLVSFILPPATYALLKSQWFIDGRSGDTEQAVPGVEAA